MIDLFEYALFLLIRTVVCALPFSVAGRVGAFLGTAAYRVTGFRKNLTLENLRHAFPDMTEKERQRIAAAAYRNYGISVIEMIWAAHQPASELVGLVRLPDRTAFERGLAAGKGLIVVSAHFGNWELLVHSVRLRIGIPLHIIVQRQSNAYIDHAIDKGRRRHGNTTIPMGPSAREALSALRNGAVLGVLADQSGPKESEFVTFFGRPAATHRGVAAFSLKTGAPLVLGLPIRQPDGTYEVIFEEIDRGGLDRYSEENIRELTARHVAALERFIRKYPDHWLWMHKRWKHTAFYQAGREEATASG
jgi:KDO2-lipid IV(A) lauroyltransferase